MLGIGKIFTNNVLVFMCVCLAHVKSVYVTRLHLHTWTERTFQISYVVFCML